MLCKWVINDTNCRVCLSISSPCGLLIYGFDVSTLVIRSRMLNPSLFSQQYRTNHCEFELVIHCKIRDLWCNLNSLSVMNITEITCYKELL